MGDIIKSFKKYFLMLIFFVLVVLLTIYTIYDKESFILLKNNLKDVKVGYVSILIMIIALYFILQGIYMKSILSTLKQKISLKKGIFYSMIEFYFSGITPSSTGGQPVQLYYMTKDNIPIRKSYITLMLNTVYFKLIIIIMGILALIFKSGLIFSSRTIYIFFFILGFVVDLFIVIACLFLVFKQDLIKKTLVKLVNIGKRFRVFRKKAESINVAETATRYKDEIAYISSHKKTVFINFIITFIQRLLLFSVAYVIYRALGFNSYSYFDLLLIQSIVQVSIEAFPLPGGAGLSEGLLHNMFVMMFASKLADIGMLFTRTFSFYIPLMVCGIVILIYGMISKKKQNTQLF